MITDIIYLLEWNRFASAVSAATLKSEIIHSKHHKNNKTKKNENDLIYGL